MYPSKSVKAELQTMAAQQMSKKASKKIDKETRVGLLVAVAFFATIITVAFIVT